MLEANADKDKATNDGYTPLFVAAEQRHLEVLRFLLEAEADKDKARMMASRLCALQFRQGIWRLWDICWTRKLT